MARVLVVDDDESILELVRRRLSVEGHEVHTSKEALGTSRRVREIEPDVVVLDQQMPALSGENLVKVIHEGCAVQPKIILFSSLPVEDLEEKAASSGADDFLCKTEGMAALHEKILSVLGSG